MSLVLTSEIISVTMKSKDSISITEAPEEAIYFFSHKFSLWQHRTLIIDWDWYSWSTVSDPPPPLFFCFLQRNFAIVILLAVSISISYKLEFSFIWSLKKYLCSAYCVSDTVLGAGHRAVMKINAFTEHAFVFYISSNSAIHSYSKTRLH